MYKYILGVCLFALALLIPTTAYACDGIDCDGHANHPSHFTITIPTIYLDEGFMGLSDEELLDLIADLHMEQIRDFIQAELGVNGIASRNLLCTVFGHSWSHFHIDNHFVHRDSQGHKVSCRWVQSVYRGCSRCDAFEFLRQGYSGIVCG